MPSATFLDPLTVPPNTFGCTLRQRELKWGGIRAPLGVGDMRSDVTTRRDVLRGTGVAAVATVAGCVVGRGEVRHDGDRSEYSDGGTFGGKTPTPIPEESPTGDGGGDSESGSGGTPTGTTSGGSSPSFGGWLSDVANYDGVIDETGNDAVTVQVGVDNGGQAFGFGPAAIQVSTGTEVTWEWTGDGGQHNVVGENADLESELTGESGFTYSQTFAESGTVRYFCSPHKALGMKGVVVIE
jgi:halocyanin-like protein